MSLQLSTGVPVFLLLVCLQTGSAHIRVIQEPFFLNVTEGSTQSMKCRIQGNISNIWYITWHHNKTNGISHELSNSSHIVIYTSVRDRFSCLTRKSIDIGSSGTYICEFGTEIPTSLKYRNGTHVTVNGITDLMVNQTPERINTMQGSQVALECRFKTLNDGNHMSVRWQKHGLGEELTNKSDSLLILINLQKGFASLILKNTTVKDSGIYVCKVENSARNLSGSGKETHVVITEAGLKDITVSIGIGAAAGAGAIVVLLVVGFFMWRRRQKISKGISMSRSEPEIVPTKEQGGHPPLDSRKSDVIYAHLHFKEWEVQQVDQVLYAEVRTGSKPHHGKKNQRQLNLSKERERRDGGKR